MRVLLALAVGFAVLGCGGPPPPSQFPTARAAIDRMRDTHSCSRGVVGEGKSESFGEEGRRVANVLFWAVLPDKLRFEAISDIGGILLTLTSNGRQFGLYDRPNKEFLTGPASACNVARFTRVPVPPFALVQLLRGEAPILVHEPPSATIAWKSDRYVIRIESKHDASEEIQIEPHPDDWALPWDRQRVRVLAVRVEQYGYDLYQAELSDHAPAASDSPAGPACSAEVPRRVHLLVPDGDRDVLLRYKEVAHNPAMPSGLFEQQAPKFTKLRYMECTQ